LKNDSKWSTTFITRYFLISIVFAFPNGTRFLHSDFLGDNQEMDINKMLAELRMEREQIEEAIMTLERLARGRGRRRGRPPAWMSMIKRRGRPPGSKNRPKSEPKGAGTKTAAA
jgi:hypothetical protein